jgi:hypothetical protein
MATGGVFKLITNDGKQDRMLMATQMLRNRLETVRANRRAKPEIKDETPTLLDIERTHVLFTNAHFKPFVAIGYEYNKVNTGAGTVQLGSEVQFSIPQFGDFFADMVLRVSLSAPEVTYPGTAPPVYDRPTVAWAEYPGERLLKKVAFEVNGNPLDSYTSDAIVMHRKFAVQPNKEVGWKRCVGQELPKEGWMDNDQSAANIDHRLKVAVCDGAQTPKTKQTGLDMLIPLLFWCNKDPRLAVPSVAIPYGQRFINITLASKDEMVGRQYRGAGVAGDSSLTTPTISNMSLYINNIFVNPEIHKIFIRRIGFTLIRVHRQQSIATSLADHEILLQNLKWPIECMFVGLRPSSQKTNLRDWHKFTEVTETTYSVPTVGLGSGGLVDLSEVDYDATGVGGAADALDFTTVTIATGVAGTSQLRVEFDPVADASSATALVSTKTIDRLTVSAHGINLYNDLPADFFNCYTPYTYGGPHIRTPDDEGVVMIPFNLYPGTYQPSGHVNVSRAREFYIRFISSVIGQATPGELVVIASAVNFLLISDGSAVLRYST